MRNNNFKQELLFMVIVVLFWFGQYVYIPYQTIYLNQNNISEYFIGIVVGVYGVSQFVCRFPIGLIANFIERHKKFIILGCFLSGLASIFRVYLASDIGFLLGNLFSGFASTMWISFMVFYLHKYSENNQQRATSRIIMLNNIGILLAFIVSTVLYNKIGMKNICILSIMSGSTACILSFILYEERETSDIKYKISDLTSCLKNKRLLLMGSLAIVQQGVQMTTAMSFTNRILQTLTNNSSIIGVSSIIYMVSAVFSSFIGSTGLMKKKEPKFWVITIFVLLALYSFLVSNIKNVSLILFLQIIPGVSSGILFSFLTSEALKDIPKYQKSTAMGLYQAIFSIGMTVFPIIVGKIIENYNIKIAYWFLTIIIIITIILAYIYYYKILKENNI